MMPLLGIVAEIIIFSTHHQDQSMERLATRERGVHLHTLEDRDAEELQERGWWSRTRSDSDRGRFQSKHRIDSTSAFNTRTARGRLLLLDPARKG